MKVIITENKIQLITQKKLDEVLQVVKDEAEREPRWFSRNFRENIDNVESVEIVQFEVNKEHNMAFTAKVRITLENDIAFGKWDIIESIIDELRFQLNLVIHFKVNLKLDSLEIKNEQFKNW